MRARLLGLPAAALAAGLPTLLAGLLVAPDPAHLVGPRDDTVRTRVVDPPPDLALSTDEALDGAHPVTGPGEWAVQPAVDRPGRGDRARGVPIRVSGTYLPARVLLAYRDAAAALRRSDPACHLDWSLIAGIGKVESGHAFGGAVDRKGRTVTPILGPVLDGAGDYAAIADTDGGHWDGDTTWDRAVGPMQFIPSTWAVWGRDGDGNEVVDPSDVDDASLATASYLCAGDRDLRKNKDRRSAVFSYNHSWDYVDLVLAWADAYATGTPVTGPLADAARDGGRRHGGGDGTTAVLGPPIGATPKATPSPSGSPAAPASAAPTVEPAPAPAATAAQGGETPAAAGTPAATPTTAPPDPGPTTTPAPAPTATPTGCPSPSPSGSASPDPSGTAEPSPSPSTSPSGTADPTADPSGTPTPSPSGSGCPTG